ncbi:MAG TPA: molybdenum cofactor guanylyltransferase [Candidatus Baltobacteraceae bacterium]|jgi:molybdopterin-guanine dinucleotide biosynthesis protein A
MRRALAHQTINLAVCLLAGGESTRLPGKLESDAGGMPLLVRVYRNLAPIAPVTISAKAGFPPELDAALDAPVVVDRWARRGPLGGLLSAFGEMRAARVFVVAGDLPRVNASVFDRLALAWSTDCEAVVPEHVTAGVERIEPLCALYDRLAFLREAYPIFTSGSGSVRSVVERLRATRIYFPDAGVFANVNTAKDHRALFQR